jgi:hypothetical protein
VEEGAVISCRFTPVHDIGAMEHLAKLQNKPDAWPNRSSRGFAAVNSSATGLKNIAASSANKERLFYSPALQIQKHPSIFSLAKNCT